jgi:hypothetical protein
MLSAELRKWKEKVSICYLQASVNRKKKHPCVVFRQSKWGKNIHVLSLG